MNLISPETRMMGLQYGEEIMIVGRTMWTQSTSVTDGQTYRQTDRITITNTVQRIASHGKNCHKTSGGIFFTHTVDTANSITVSQYQRCCCCCCCCCCRYSIRVDRERAQRTNNYFHPLIASLMSIPAALPCVLARGTSL